jgi:hypothetical protein
MVMLSPASRRSDEDCSEHFQEFGDDIGDQGEVVLLPLRFVVAPDYGRFHPATLATTGTGMVLVGCGMRIGEVCNGTVRHQVHSPFGGRLDAWLVLAGQIVLPGQPLCSLSPTATISAAGR